MIGNLAFSYDLTEDLKRGDFWQNIPLTFIYKKNLVNPSLDELTKNAINDSIEEWNKELNIENIWYFDKTKDAKTSANSNIIRWSYNFAIETGYTATNTMAITIRYATPPLLIRAEIILNPQYTSLHKLSNLKLVIMHELGHTIGLDHSTDPTSVMYRSLSLNDNIYQSITTDDVDGITQALNHHKEFKQKPLNLRNTSSYKVINCGSSVTKNYLNPAIEKNTWLKSLTILYSLILGLSPILILPLKSKVNCKYGFIKKPKNSKKTKPRK